MCLKWIINEASRKDQSVSRLDAVIFSFLKDLESFGTNEASTKTQVNLTCAELEDEKTDPWPKVLSNNHKMAFVSKSFKELKPLQSRLSFHASNLPT